MDKPVQIVADVGGTNARFAYVQEGGVGLQGLAVMPCAQYPFLVDVIHAFTDLHGLSNIQSLCLAIAGHIERDWVDLPNNHWAFSQDELRQSLGFPISIINDFSAQVLSLLEPDTLELHWLTDHRPAGGQVKAIMGAGTGLGVSALTPAGDILPSEGGHVSFAPVNGHEERLLEVLRRRYQRVSVERVLSGMGLANLYWANCTIAGLERELPAVEVTAGARAGDAHCVQAVHDFQAILGAFAGDVALMIGAMDGVYLSGGILPKMMDLVEEVLILERFQDKGRYRHALEETPLAIVLAEQPGLLGCVQALQGIPARSF